MMPVRKKKNLDFKVLLFAKTFYSFCNHIKLTSQYFFAYAGKHFHIKHIGDDTLHCAKL